MTAPDGTVTEHRARDGERNMKKPPTRNITSQQLRTEGQPAANRTQIAVERVNN